MQNQFKMMASLLGLRDFQVLSIHLSSVMLCGDISLSAGSIDCRVVLRMKHTWTKENRVHCCPGDS